MAEYTIFFTDDAIKIASTSTLIARSMSIFKVPFGFRGTIATCTTSGVLPTSALMVEWQIDEMSVSGNLISESFVQEDENSISITAELISEIGFFSSDIGNYTCVIQMPNDTSTLELKTISLQSAGSQSLPIEESCSRVPNGMKFQIRILETDCQSWEEDDPQISADLREELILVISSECPTCITLTTGITITDGPSCSGSVANGTVFRGTISTGDKSRTGFIFCTLSRWKQHRPLVMLNGTQYFVDMSCVLRLASNSSPECQRDGIKALDYILWIIGGCTGVFLIVILTVACIFVASKK